MISHTLVSLPFQGKVAVDSVCSRKPRGVSPRVCLGRFAPSASIGNIRILIILLLSILCPGENLKVFSLLVGLVCGTSRRHGLRDFALSFRHAAACHLSQRGRLCKAVFLSAIYHSPKITFPPKIPEIQLFKPCYIHIRHPTRYPRISSIRGFYCVLRENHVKIRQNACCIFY